jgi:hypothetical protein
MRKFQLKPAPTMTLLKPFAFIAVILLLALPSCNKKDELTTQEKVSAQLTTAAGWQDPVVTVDGVDYSDLYKDFSIKFDKSTYTTTSGAPMWKASGTWVFINEEATLMKMDDKREVELLVTDDFLELSFQWEENTFEPGRVNSVKGKQKFKLKKKP